MSRLESFIRRMVAQRDCLNHIAHDLPVPKNGAICEVGLGNGRTYSHLRMLFPKRRIIAFDRAVKAHADSVPVPENMVVGEIEQTLQQFIGRDVALLHVDIGSGHDDLDALILAWLPDIVARVLAPGGFVLSGLPLDNAGLKAKLLPQGIDLMRYFLYEKQMEKTV